MRVLVTGGTGVIGSAVVRALVGEGHAVVGLARSYASAASLKGMGAAVLRANIREPEGWIGRIGQVDGVIHAAADFRDDMGEVETRFLDRLLPSLAALPSRPRLIYTGGCWLYGETGTAAATESTPFDPLPAFAWMVPNLRRVLSAPGIQGMAVHPALVYTDEGGVLAPFIDAARETATVRIVGSEEVHWPLVHADDLAKLYVLVLERGQQGQMYNGAAVEGYPVGALARWVARGHGTAACRVQVITPAEAAAERGEWARGYALDQRMSSAKARRELDWLPARAIPDRDHHPTSCAIQERNAPS